MKRFNEFGLRMSESTDRKAQDNWPIPLLPSIPLCGSSGSGVARIARKAIEGFRLPMSAEVACLIISTPVE